MIRGSNANKGMERECSSSGSEHGDKPQVTNKKMRTRQSFISTFGFAPSCCERDSVSVAKRLVFVAIALY